ALLWSNYSLGAAGIFDVALIGQREKEGAAEPWFAVYTYLASVQLHDGAGNGQAQPGAVGPPSTFRGCRTLVEFVEDELLLVAGDAGPFVSHEHPHGAVSWRRAEHDLTAGRAVLVGVR